MPTLLVHAEWDRDTPAYMAQTLFPLLVNAPGKRYVQLPEGTHTIMMEKNRLMLFEAVQAFLDEFRKVVDAAEIIHAKSSRAEVDGVTASDLDHLVGQFVGIEDAGREVLGQHRTALLDRGDEAVRRPPFPGGSRRSSPRPH